MSVTDTELLDLWQFEARSKLSEHTSTEYRRYLDAFRRHLGSSLREATGLDCKRFVLSNAGRWSPATLLYVRRALRSFFAWLHAEKLIDTNPALSIAAVKVSEAPVRVATTDTRDRLVAAALTVRDVALVEVVFGTGARRGEAVALTVADVSIAERTVFFAKTKVGKPRTAPLDPRATAALAEWLLERARIASTGPALWLTPDGRPLSPDGAKTVLRRTADRAGVAFTSHDARRSYATRWLEAGGSETGLMAVAGWSSPAMVGRYVRMGRERLAHDEARRLFG